MIFQYWTILHLVSAISTLAVLLRVLSVPALETRRSRLFYSMSLITLLCWTGSEFVLSNTPSNFFLLAHVLTRLNFILVSVVVLFFVLSALFLIGRTTPIELLVAGSPIFMITAINLISGFEMEYRYFGWYGDISSSVLRYIWLGTVVLAMVYSIARLYALRKVTISNKIKRRMDIFIGSTTAALTSGTVLYLISIAVNWPVLSVISINFSLAPAYLAFASPKRRY